MTSVKVNGVTIEVPDGANISVTNGTVYVNGQPHGENGAKVNKVEVVGNVGSVTSDRADINVYGDVSGGVRAGNNVAVGGRTTGDVTAGNNVACGDVGGSVKAQNNVACKSVGGDAKAGNNLVRR